MNSVERRWVLSYSCRKVVKRILDHKSFQKTKVAACFCFKSRFFPKIKEVLAIFSMFRLDRLAMGDPIFTSGRVLQPQLALTPNLACISFGLRRTTSRP